ncbi:hypothetical protein SDC9_127335 [bioreactor metagenome]|uniref:Uncharacterized protein n=1 Tax=bioreactor metagenome TaxID=1076179 RepID=A0A645CTT5_9ZZZZ
MYKNTDEIFCTNEENVLPFRIENNKKLLRVADISRMKKIKCQVTLSYENLSC